MHQYLLLTLSALAYAYSLVLPHASVWLIIPALAGFIIGARHGTFLQGYTWGLIACGIPLSDTAWTLYALSESTSFWRIVPALLFMLYIPFYTAIAWTLLHHTLSYIHKDWASWIVTTLFCTGFWWFITDACLWVTGACDGCFILNPLLAFIDAPIFAWAHTYLSQKTIAIIVNALASAVAYGAMRSYACGAAYLCAIILVLFLPFHVDNACPTWVQQIVVIPQAHHITGNIQSAARYIKHTFDTCLKLHPQATCIILPESAIYLPRDCTIEALTAHWNNVQAHIILGSFSHCKHATHNTCFAIKDGTIYYTHHKRHLMPFIERTGCALSWAAKWYYPELSCGSQEQAILPLTPELHVIPALCSELFCQKSLPGNAEPILALCNDRWFMRSHTKELLARTARLQAMRWQRPIIYISYTKNFFICPSGAIYPLLCV